MHPSKKARHGRRGGKGEEEGRRQQGKAGENKVTSEQRLQQGRGIVLKKGNSLINIFREWAGKGGGCYEGVEGREGGASTRWDGSVLIAGIGTP